MEIRRYQVSDAKYLVNIYYNTIHKVNCRDYSEEQINVWAPDKCLELTDWINKWESLVPYVAVYKGQPIGFVEFENNGHIDCFYCHHDWIGKGIGTMLMETVINNAKLNKISRIYAEVSITAKPFFRQHGFDVVKAQTIVRNGVALRNFIMEKYLDKRG